MLSTDSIEFREMLLSHIPNSSPASGGEFVLTKCVFCDDGKNHNSRHLYISIDVDTQIPWCYCHICKESSLVTSEFLNEYFGIYDTSFIIKHNKRISAIKKSHKYKSKRRGKGNRKIYGLNNFHIEDNKISQTKLNYINRRLGLELSYKDLLDNKVTLNLIDLLKTNKIETLTRDIRVVEGLDKYFIGFITADNSKAVCRKVTDKPLNKSIDKRYVKYDIFQKGEGESFYVLPTEIPTVSNDRTQIHIAEGPFDILSIKYNVRQESYNSIYASANGSNYLGLVKYIVGTLQIMRFDLHIYIDDGIDMYTMNVIKNYLEPSMCPVYIHKNIKDGEKDFGVPRDRIEENIIKL